ncbi:MAG: hypothetical protein Q9191_003836 [Dirinaria sp. TL-2023a]
MPTYRSITIAVVTQHDIYNLPEYPPPSAPNDPFSSPPTLINEERALVSVYIPTFPGSQFWITYSIAPPYPPKALYYFKLYLKGKCVVSWGCDEEHGYRGRTMFAFYDSGEECMGEPAVERRVLCFNAPKKKENLLLDDRGDLMEIKIYRAKARQRIRPLMEELRHLADPANDTKGRKANSIVKAGFLTENDPQGFYKYALIDPLDKPFATFHYLMRTWDQLRTIGVLSPPQSANASIYADEVPGRSTSPEGSNKTISSNQTTSSSSSSPGTQEHTFVRGGKNSTISPPKWAIFAPKLTKPTCAARSPQKVGTSEESKMPKRGMNKAATAPSLISLSPPNNATATPAKFASLVRGTRISPPRSGAPSRIPTPSFRTSSPRRASPPSPPRRASATRRPTPIPSKADRILGRTPTYPRQSVHQDDADYPESNLPRSRSGSMGLLMSAVSSAMNRRRAMAEGDIEAYAPIGTPDLPTADEGQFGPLQKQAEENHPNDEDAYLSDVLDSAPKDRSRDGKDDFRSERVGRGGNDAGTIGIDTAKASSFQSATDTSSARKKRWGMFRGTKQNNVEK